MKYAFIASTLASLSTVLAQRDMNTTICDYYTSALLMDNTAENQYTLLKLLVNTVVIGNYTMPNMNAVPGILAPGEVNGTEVNLLPFFAGTSGPTTNRNGEAVAGVNFLDGGGATPLMNNELPEEGSNEFTLLTHLYQYFGYLLECSMQGEDAFPSYEGNPSQYAVHKFMYLTYAQTTYFITQVALAAASFGVATDDIAIVGSALNTLFNVRCAPAISIPAEADALPQSICISSDCPLAINSTCSLYAQNSTGNATVGPNSTVTGAGDDGSSASDEEDSTSSGSAAGGTTGGTGSSSGSDTDTSSASIVGGYSVIIPASVTLAMFALGFLY